MKYANFKTSLALCVLAGLSLAGCSTIQDAPPIQGTHVAIDTPEDSGVDVGSDDIVAMSDQMCRDMLQCRALVGRATPPRIVIDAQYFRNESTDRVDLNLITDRLLVELNRAAAGRIVFVSREDAGMVEQERELKRDDVTDAGTNGLRQGTLGVDYRLTGRVTSRDAVNSQTGLTSRFHEFAFFLVDTESAGMVWTNQYSFKKIARDDVVYR